MRRTRINMRARVNFNFNLIPWEAYQIFPDDDETFTVNISGEYELFLKCLEGEILIEAEDISILSGIYEIVPGIGIKLFAGNSLSFKATTNTGSWNLESEFPFEISSSKLGFLEDGNYKMIKLDEDLERNFGDRRYELKNHLGNVHAVISDRKLQVEDPNNLGTVDYYTSNVTSYTDYYPFGMEIGGRTGHGSEGFRYGFNGKEQDPDWSGQGNMYDYGFRIYNPRLGKFLSVDPLASDFPWYTPYQYAGNMPIWAIDIDGLEPEVKGSVLVGYNVQAGQGPTQIAQDINNPETQKEYGYCLIEPVDWYQIVHDNIKEVKQKSHVVSFRDINDPGYWDMNINPGDYLRINSVSNCITPTASVAEMVNPINIGKGTKLKLTIKTAAEISFGPGSAGIGKAIISLPITSVTGSWEYKVETEYSPSFGVQAFNPLTVTKSKPGIGLGTQLHFTGLLTQSLSGPNLPNTVNQLEYDYYTFGAIAHFGEAMGYKDGEKVLDASGHGGGLSISAGGSMVGEGTEFSIIPNSLFDSIRRARHDTTLPGRDEFIKNNQEYFEKLKP